MKQLFYSFILIGLLSCGKGVQYDATGSFEADEVIVSSELAGKIVTLYLNEGDTLSSGKVVGTIDAENIELQKQQVEASIEALNQKNRGCKSAGATARRPACRAAIATGQPAA